MVFGSCYSLPSLAFLPPPKKKTSFFLEVYPQEKNSIPVVIDKKQ